MRKRIVAGREIGKYRRLEGWTDWLDGRPRRLEVRNSGQKERDGSRKVDRRIWTNA